MYISLGLEYHIRSGLCLKVMRNSQVLLLKLKSAELEEDLRVCILSVILSETEPANLVPSLIEKLTLKDDYDLTDYLRLLTKIRGVGSRQVQEDDESTIELNIRETSQILNSVGGDGGDKKYNNEFIQQLEKDLFTPGYLIRRN